MLTKIFGVSKEIVKPFGLFLTIYLLVFGLNTYLIVYLKETYNYSSLMTVCISCVLLLLLAILFHWYFLKKDKGIYENTLSKMSNWFVFITLEILIIITRLLCVTFLWTGAILMLRQDFDLFLLALSVPGFLIHILEKYAQMYLINIVLGCSILKVLTKGGRKFLIVVSALIVVGFIGKILLVYLLD